MTDKQRFINAVRETLIEKYPDSYLKSPIILDIIGDFDTFSDITPAQFREIRKDKERITKVRQYIWDNMEMTGSMNSISFNVFGTSYKTWIEKNPS
jgi:hypothetical protein|tara:strand:+ start:375 stop:662 length:288 start_codon:yes stop_codon:yes gene_type:complete